MSPSPIGGDLSAGWGDKFIRASGLGGLLIVVLAGLWYMDKQRMTEHRDIAQSLSCNNVIAYLGLLAPEKRDQYISNLVLYRECADSLKPLIDMKGRHG